MMFVGLMLACLVACVVNVIVHGWLGVYFLIVWLSVYLDHVRDGVSRRANVDRYYLLSTRWFGVFLHHIKADEKIGVYHTHPWSWFSIVLRGRYWDHRPGKNNEYLKIVRRFNSCRAGDPHRVILPGDPVWTLCFRGPRRIKWQVQDGDGHVLETEPWTGTENPQRTEYA